MRLYGVPVSEEDCRAFVTSLMIVDSDAALDAARTIAHGLDLEAQLIALTPEQRDSILACLEDVTSPALGELRGALTRDRLDRGA